MRDGRPVTVEVSSDGAGLVSRAGTALVAQVVDKVGLTRALLLRLAAIKQRRRGHDPGRVIRDLAVMVADGGECVSGLGAVREQDALFGAVASDSTAFRMVDRIASEPGLLDAVRVAHGRARARFWELDGAPERLTLDVDATLITAHSEKEKAAGNYKLGFRSSEAGGCPCLLDLRCFRGFGGAALTWVKLCGDDHAAELGEHVSERRGGLGLVPGGALAVVGDVVGVVSVQRIPGDRRCHCQKLERDGSLNGFGRPVARFADSELLLAFFVGDLGGPAVGIAFDQLRGSGSEVGRDAVNLSL